MKPEIIAKIQKLLALANSTNENEARLAASRAQELLVKYNLTSSEIENHNSDYMREDLATQKQVTKKERFANILLSQFFFVEIVMIRRGAGRGTTIAVLGKPHNVEIALSVRNFLLRAFDESFVTYKKATGCGSNQKASYQLGLYKGLCEQLEAAKQKVQTETGLVVVRDVQLRNFLAKTMGPTSAASMRMGDVNRDAVQAGQDAGRNLRITRDLKAGATQSGRLLK